MVCPGLKCCCEVIFLTPVICQALSRSISPEAIVAYEQASAASRRLTDLGIHCLFSGDKTTVSVGVAMTYLSGQTVSARKLMSQIKQAAMHWNKINKNNKGASALQSQLYEKATDELQSQYKVSIPPAPVNDLHYSRSYTLFRFYRC